MLYTALDALYDPEWAPSLNSIWASYALTPLTSPSSGFTRKLLGLSICCHLKIWAPRNQLCSSSSRFSFWPVINLADCLGDFAFLHQPAIMNLKTIWASYALTPLTFPRSSSMCFAIKRNLWANLETASQVVGAFYLLPFDILCSIYANINNKGIQQQTCTRQIVNLRI